MEEKDPYYVMDNECCCNTILSPTYVTVELNKFVDLVKDSERCAVIKNSILSSLKKTSYGVSVNERVIDAVAQSVFPCEYWKWYNSNEAED